MATKKINGVTLPGSDDTTPKTLGEKMKTLFDSYVKSEQLEEDFKNLKSSDRLQFIQKMAPYFVMKADSEVKKKIVIGEPWTEERLQNYRKMLGADKIIPQEFYDEDWRGKTWGEFYESCGIL